MRVASSIQGSPPSSPRIASWMAATSAFARSFESPANLAATYGCANSSPSAPSTPRTQRFHRGSISFCPVSFCRIANASSTNGFDMSRASARATCQAR